MRRLCDLFLSASKISVNLTLKAMRQILQHQLPPRFQKVRHYGLHAGSTYRKWQSMLPAEVKRNGATVRTVLQILKALLKETPFKCDDCGSTDFEVTGVAADTSFMYSFLDLPARSPPRRNGTDIAENENL